MADAPDASARSQWPALESNPEVLTNFIQAIGAPSTAAFHDVFGLDEELLGMVPQPVHALVLLYPHSGHAKAPRSRDTPSEGEAFFLWQTERLGNACGSIASIHSVVNSEVGKDVAPDSALAKFLAKANPLHPEDRGMALDSDDEIRALHSKFSLQGQTDGTIDQDQVCSHFIAFVHVNGRLLELDGLKASPIDHGPSSSSSLLSDAAGVVKREYFEKHPEETSFSLLSLGPAQED
mmetsp:Transcript_37201/g.76247  ORF Transcript_37201/g.76247 Transcript_37201/m.76247 type:complete len:236 (+) Transcript_37201:3-710(+)